MLSFVWEEEKAKINLEKHGISFAEAKGVFYDEHARLIADETMEVINENSDEI